MTTPNPANPADPRAAAERIVALAEKARDRGGHRWHSEVWESGSLAPILARAYLDSNPPLQEIQAAVNQWQRETFIGADAEDHANKCCDEAVELLDAIRRDWPDQAERVASEAADVAITVMGVCGSYGIDLASAIAAKMEKNRARAWGRQDDGTFQHKGESR